MSEQVWIVMGHGYGRGDGDEVRAVAGTELDGARLTEQYRDHAVGDSDYGSRGFTLEGPFPVQRDVKVDFPYIEERAKQGLA